MPTSPPAAPHVLRLPLVLAREVTLTGGSVASLRLALLVIDRLVAAPPEDDALVGRDEDEEREAEFEGEPPDDGVDEVPEPPLTAPSVQNGGRLVRVPLAEVVAATGIARTNLARTCGFPRLGKEDDVPTGLAVMRAAWTDADGHRVEVPLVHEAGWGGGRSARGDAALHAEVDGALAAHLGRDSEVEVPVDALRSVSKRSGVLMLLRGLAALRGRTGTDAVRVSVDIDDLPLYTGYADAGSPWTQVTDYVSTGALDLTTSSSPVVVKVLANGRVVHDPRPRAAEMVDFEAWQAAVQDAPPPRRLRSLPLRTVELVWDHRRPTRARRPRGEAEPAA